MYLERALMSQGVIVAIFHLGKLRERSLIITVVLHGAHERMLVLLHSHKSSVSKRVNEHLETSDPDSSCMNERDVVLIWTKQAFCHFEHDIRHYHDSIHPYAA